MENQINWPHNHKVTELKTSRSLGKTSGQLIGFTNRELTSPDLLPVCIHMPCSTCVCVCGRVFETWPAASAWPPHRAWPASHPLRPPPAGGTCPPALWRAAGTAPVHWTSGPPAPPSADAPEWVKTQTHAQSSTFLINGLFHSEQLSTRQLLVCSTAKHIAFYCSTKAFVCLVFQLGGMINLLAHLTLRPKMSQHPAMDNLSFFSLCFP